MPTDTSHRQKTIAFWLFTVAAMVFAMIVIGGLTRLTQSGLSMVDWRPVTGWLPPLGADEWDHAFARYREYPEYQKRNLGMTLDEFKSIFWLEYAHRLWGRIIGAAFLVPLAVFAALGWIGGGLVPRLVGLFILGGLQGVLGWYMVKSGLVSRPDVSQYRLAAHLSLSLIILGYLLWLALGLIADRRAAPSPAPAGLVRGAMALTALIFVTMLSGAFVSGLDAGLIYNTFPLMDGAWVPDGMYELTPFWANWFENVTHVQFDHRVLAMTTVAAAAAFWWRARVAPLTPGQRRVVRVLIVAVLVQAGLGVSTLVLVVPVPLASLHQTVAVVLFSAAVWLVHELCRGTAE